MQEISDQLIVTIGIIAALAVALGKVAGPYQMEVSQAVIDAFAVPSRFRRIVNMAIGIVLGIALTVVAAMQVGEWGILPAGILAGILAAVEASKVHDRESEASPEPP